MKLQVKINDDGVVEDVKFRTFGCGSAIASSSYATTWLKGKTIDEALALKVCPKCYVDWLFGIFFRYYFSLLLGRHLSHLFPYFMLLLFFTS